MEQVQYERGSWQLHAGRQQLEHSDTHIIIRKHSESITIVYIRNTSILLRPGCPGTRRECHGADLRRAQDWLEEAYYLPVLQMHARGQGMSILMTLNVRCTRRIMTYPFLYVHQFAWGHQICPFHHLSSSLWTIWTVNTGPLPIQTADGGCTLSLLSSR